MLPLQFSPSGGKGNLNTPSQKGHTHTHSVAPAQEKIIAGLAHCTHFPPKGRIILHLDLKHTIVTDNSHSGLKEPTHTHTNKLTYKVDLHFQNLVGKLWREMDHSALLCDYSKVA